MSKNPYEQNPHIVTEELTLRKIVDSDVDSIFEICLNSEPSTSFCYARKP